MEIIKKGKVPGPEKINQTCSNCDTEFLFELQESKLAQSIGAGAKRPFRRSIDCPLCKKTIVFFA